MKFLKHETDFVIFTEQHTISKAPLNHDKFESKKTGTFWTKQIRETRSRERSYRPVKIAYGIAA
jgi:hypothetical protein